MPERKESEVHEGYETWYFVVAPVMLIQSNLPSFKSGGAVDPFASPVYSEAPRILNPKEMLESYGIQFPEDSAVKYDPGTMILEVTNTVEQLELVEAVTESIRICGESQIYHRIEILELPLVDAIKLERSAASHFDHRAEWKVARDLLRLGKAQLADSLAIIARSGQRVHFESVLGSSVVESGLSMEGGRLSLDLDPVIGGDDYMIDVNLALEWSKSDATHFSPKQEPARIETTITTADNSFRLIGAWSSGAAKNNRRFLAFLIPSIQRVRNWYD
ncbi:MAG: hypothetical protein KDN19_11345 [Verrucomicrobiae bacterium]|nr:hypothetical protein [Verrucomicrobiae bacterium]